MGYNEETKFWINNYIEEIIKMFPNLFTREELYKRISEGINSNIEFVELDKNLTGLYNKKNKEIFISNKLKSEKNKDLVIFHEITHAVTKNISNIQSVKGNPYISEILTTLLEIKYANSKYDNKNKKTNGYIDNFSKQLYTIYGDEILEKFLKDPENIFEIIHAIGEKFIPGAKKSTFNIMVRHLQSVITSSSKVFTDTDLKIHTQKFEEQLIVQLFQKVEKEGIESNLERLNNLYLLQHYPEHSYVYAMIKNIDKDKLAIYPDLNLIYKIFKNENTEKIIENITQNDLNNCISSSTKICLIEKLFKFDNSLSSILELVDSDQDEIQNMSDKLFEDKKRMYDDEKFYKGFLTLLVDKKLQYSEIISMTYRTETSTKKDFYNELYNRVDNLMEALLENIFGKKLNTTTAGIYLNDELKLILDSENNYYEHVNLQNLDNLEIKKDIRKLTEFLLSNNISNAYIDLKNIDSIEEDLISSHFVIYHFDEENKLIKSALVYNEENEIVPLDKKGRKEVELGENKSIMSTFSNMKKK